MVGKNGGLIVFWREEKKEECVLEESVELEVMRHREEDLDGGRQGKARQGKAGGRSNT